MQQRTLRVTGTGRLAVRPDLMVFTFALEGTDRDYGTAMELLHERTETLRRTLEGLKVKREDIRTTDFGVEQQSRYDREKEKSVYIGFRAHHELILELPLQQKLANEILRAVSAVGGGFNTRIHFSVRDKEKYKIRTLEMAIANARIYAEAIARVAGLRLQEITDVNYSFSEVRFRSDDIALYEASEPGPMAVPDINPADLEGQEVVTLTWLIS